MAEQVDLFTIEGKNVEPRTQFLAAMFATWRYGDKPKKKERAAARALAEEVVRRIDGLPTDERTA